MATIAEALAQAKAYHRAGQLQRAEEMYRQILQTGPADAHVYYLLGAACQALGKLDDAIASFQQAVRLKPDHGEAYNHLGIALAQQSKPDEAVASFRRAVQFRPELAEAYYNLGKVCQNQGDLDAAVAACRRAIEIKSDYADAYRNLGNALKGQGKLDEAAACYRRALVLKPDSASAHSNLVFCQQYRPGVTLAGLAAAHAAWEQQHAVPLQHACPLPVNDPNPDRRLRIGFVSADFGRHPVGWFSVRALEGLRRHDCDTVCYSDRLQKDDMTLRIKAAAGIWREASGAKCQHSRPPWVTPLASPRSRV